MFALRLCLAAAVMAMAVFNDEATAYEEKNLTFHTGDWINKTEPNHPDHEDHEFVAMMSSELVEAMLKRRGLRGFDKMIIKACGAGPRSIAHFTELVFCLRRTKESMMDLVENYTNIIPNLPIRDHIAVTAFCGLLPKIVDCKEKLCSEIQDCEDNTGFLELVNIMHRLLIKHYCEENGKTLAVGLSSMTRECGRHLLKTVHNCWGKAGLDYTDLTMVLRRLSKKESLCQQLVGTQQCLANNYLTGKDDCNGTMGDMISTITNAIKKEFNCIPYGRDGNHLRDL